MITDIAGQMALYLQSAGQGTIGSDLVIDTVPEAPGELIVLTHHGGSAEFKLDAPDMWCKLALVVRSATPSGAQERIWNALSKLIEPSGGLIAVNGRTYTAEVTALPVIQDRDGAGRYLMKSVMIVRQVTATQEAWITALADFSAAVLGTGWRVYRGFAGTSRPSVSWQCTSLQLAPSAGVANRLSKRYAGRISARTTQEYEQAAQALLDAMAVQNRLRLGPESGRWLTISPSGAELQPANLATGICTVTLTGPLERPGDNTPPIAGMHVETTIQQ